MWFLGLSSYSVNAYLLDAVNRKNRSGNATCGWAFHSMRRTLDPVPRKEGREEGKFQKSWENSTPLSSWSWMSRVQRNDRILKPGQGKAHIVQSHSSWRCDSVWQMWFIECDHSGHCGFTGVKGVEESMFSIRMPLLGQSKWNFQKKKPFNFRADIIVNDFLPFTFLHSIALNYFPQRTQCFPTPAPGGMDQGNWQLSLIFSGSITRNFSQA